MSNLMTGRSTAAKGDKVKRTAPIFFGLALFACGHKDAKSNDLPSAPKDKGGCMYRGPILADPIKLGSTEAANKAPSSWGEQCRDNGTEDDCFQYGKKGDKLFESPAWVPAGCSDLYVAKCTHAWGTVYLYEGPTTAAEPGGLKAQKDAFAFACKTDGIEPVLK